MRWKGSEPNGYDPGNPWAKQQPVKPILDGDPYPFDAHIGRHTSGGGSIVRHDRFGWYDATAEYQPAQPPPMCPTCVDANYNIEYYRNLAVTVLCSKYHDATAARDYTRVTNYLARWIVYLTKHLVLARTAHCVGPATAKDMVAYLPPPAAHTKAALPGGQP